ncbi:MAG TPA: lycopene cyclase domain-containing protein [Prolixibacteraceae bacterium]|jgi:lycopene cyclase domain-containing protein|nr:lycopene cyclase domain-containing protein [Bacteroidales bacterium]HNQ36423.1 lycopene cyclase domain-containing protein [Prolixibacteraceae bacterium]HOY52344.1 lycopene cyclase domain-containing protein [Prolixibacteraceae bacterium]HPJ79971.1 lycopene cyclase domain-containing protein [Prolixibacteraceae bacterium]HRV89475.1 lycopene cyclase domain-containing protein [Prolixibacteraceae bacterium]
MRWLYFSLLAGSILVPALWTFSPKLRFYPKLPAVLLALVIVAFPFILKDILFTRLGIWGFNPEYFSGIRVAGLPLEEWLFFAVIPYASIFLHETVVYLKPGWILPGRAAKVISLFLAGGALLLMILFPERLYTFFNSLFLIAALLWAHWSGSEVIRRFYLTFPVILVPFLVVNGILTGSFIPGEVVWYDPAHFMGLRIFTIPAEDAGYAFSLILGNLLLSEWLFRRIDKQVQPRGE